MNDEATKHGAGGAAAHGRGGPAAHDEGGGHGADHVAGHGDDHGGGHPGAAFYVWIGLILAIVTGVEVAIYYIEALDGIEAPLLVILSSAKVVLVVMYFMHLKMEPRFLTGVFIAGVVLATFMVSALVVLYHVLEPVGTLGPLG